MSLAASSSLIVSDSERSQLVSVFFEKMRQACFIDWVVGLCLLAFYGLKLWGHEALTASDLYPLIAALAITRAGNTLTKAIADYTYWRFHRAGESYGDQVQQA